MKIVVFGDCTLVKETVAAIKKKKHTCVQLPYEALDRAEDLRDFIKGNNYEVAVFCAVNFSSVGEPFNAKTLIRFKNLQYASILYGIKKLLVLSDASDIIDETENPSILDNTSLLSPIVTSLALKDKISTVLRFFYLFGKGVKRGEAARILSAVGQKKPLLIKEDFAFSALFLTDAVNIIVQFIEKNLPKSDYSVTSDELITTLEFVKKVKSAAKKRNVSFNIDTKSAEKSDRIYGDVNDKLKEALPKTKFTAIGTAIGKTLD